MKKSTGKSAKLTDKELAQVNAGKCELAQGSCKAKAARLIVKCC